MNTLISFKVQIMTGDFELFESTHLALDECHALDMAYHVIGKHPHCTDIVAVFEGDSNISLPVHAVKETTTEEWNQVEIDMNYFWDASLMVEITDGHVFRYNTEWAESSIANYVPMEDTEIDPWTPEDDEYIIRGGWSDEYSQDSW